MNVGDEGGSGDSSIESVPVRSQANTVPETILRRHPKAQKCLQAVAQAELMTICRFGKPVLSRFLV